MLKHILLAGGLLALAPISQAATDLLVYTALESAQLPAYEAAFEEQNPEIDIRWVRNSTGVVTAKLLAEKANPQADVIWGLAASSLAILKSKAMLQSYAPKQLNTLDPRFRDSANPPAWVGMDVWASAICFNPIEAKKQGISKPTSWQDLTRPEYRGKIVMPNPASSGTGFLSVSGWLQSLGEKRAWAYMDKLDKNVAQYVHSGSKPCKMAASGEYPIGISFEYPGIRLQRLGAPVELVLPKEGLGWDIEAAAIMKGTDKLVAAQKLLDFAVSKTAMRLYGKNFAVLANPDVTVHPEELPTDYADRLVDNDFQWAASHRADILAEWKLRYGSDPS